MDINQVAIKQFDEASVTSFLEYIYADSVKDEMMIYHCLELQMVPTNTSSRDQVSCEIIHYRSHEHGSLLRSE